MKKLMLALLGLALPACLPSTINSEGPEVTLRVFPTDGFSFSNDSSNPDVDKNSATGNYDLTLQIEVSFGVTVTVGKEASDGYRYSPVNKLSGTVTPPGVTVTEADFMFDTASDSIHRRTFEGKTMISIPGAMMGGTVSFQLEVTDDEGLHGNVIDFTALLN